MLVVCQLYWPDEVAVAQMLTDLTLHLDEKNVDITVFCSNHGYEKSKESYLISENLNGIKIKRVRHFSFGKKYLVGRIFDILSFNLILLFRLIFLGRKEYDIILGLTNPPLISYFGVYVAKWKKIQFYYWAMDLQPEMSFRLGFLKRKSIVSKLLAGMSYSIYKKADRIIALDKYMKSYISEKTDHDRIAVIPVWSTNQQEDSPNRSENQFIKEHRLEEKLVVMYSGNHTIAHPLTTLLEVAKKLKDDSRFQFVFIGAGLTKQDVIKFKNDYHLENILSLPYQPRNVIHVSLGAADLQVVVLGDDLVGLTHPSKIYTAMNLAKPILYIGPSPSHVTDMIGNIEGNIIAGHGQIDLLASRLKAFAHRTQQERQLTGNANKELIESNFMSVQALLSFEDYLLNQE